MLLIVYLYYLDFIIGGKNVLSPRLKALAQQVPAGAKLADIGTDHGLVPVYLAKNGQ